MVEHGECVAVLEGSRPPLQNGGRRRDIERVGDRFRLGEPRNCFGAAVHFRQGVIPCFVRRAAGAGRRSRLKSPSSISTSCGIPSALSTSAEIASPHRASLAEHALARLCRCVCPPNRIRKLLHLVVALRIVLQSGRRHRPRAEHDRRTRLDQFLDLPQRCRLDRIARRRQHQIAVAHAVGQREPAVLHRSCEFINTSVFTRSALQPRGKAGRIASRSGHSYGIVSPVQ